MRATASSPSSSTPAFSAAEPTFRQRFMKAWHRDKFLYAMFFIPLVYFLIFHYWPMYGVLIAFKDFKIARGVWGSDWVGLKYFNDFLSDPYAWTVIRNTVLLRLYQIAFGFPMPIILALLLNEVRNQRFKRFVQTTSYLPHFISLVVVAGMIVNFLASDGIFNQIVVFFGGEAHPWLLEAKWFRLIYVASGVWQDAGWASILYLAALTAVDPTLYEAAIMDGANRWHRLIHVTIPGIMPTIIILFLLRLGTIMTIGYQKVLLLYTGATYETADVLGTFIYRRGLLGADFSYATAVGLFQAAVGLLFVIFANSISKRVSETSLW